MKVPSQTLPTEWRRCRILFCCSGDHAEEDDYYCDAKLKLRSDKRSQVVKNCKHNPWSKSMKLNTEVCCSCTLKDPDRAGDECPLAVGLCWGGGCLMSPMLCRRFRTPAAWPVWETTTELATSPIPCTKPEINSEGQPDAILLKTRLNLLRRRSIFCEANQRRMSSGWFLRTISAQSVDQQNEAIE